MAATNSTAPPRRTRSRPWHAPRPRRPPTVCASTTATTRAPAGGARMRMRTRKRTQPRRPSSAACPSSNRCPPRPPHAPSRTTAATTRRRRRVAPRRAVLPSPRPPSPARARGYMETNTAKLSEYVTKSLRLTLGKKRFGSCVRRHFFLACMKIFKILVSTYIVFRVSLSAICHIGPRRTRPRRRLVAARRLDSVAVGGGRGAPGRQAHDAKAGAGDAARTAAAVAPQAAAAELGRRAVVKGKNLALSSACTRVFRLFS